MRSFGGFFVQPKLTRLIISSNKLTHTTANPFYPLDHPVKGTCRADFLRLRLLRRIYSLAENPRLSHGAGALIYWPEPPDDRGIPTKKRNKRGSENGCCVCAGRYPVCFPSSRSVSGLALATGCVSWWVRPGRSGGGFRLVARFVFFASAGLFARRCAGRVGRAVVVRPSAGSWVVSVPVSVPPSSSSRDWGAWSALP